MRWLKRDEGISMVLVGISLAVLLALSGMAVDLGAVYVERRELRTGADAAALAIAEDCGVRTKPCDEATAWATAGQYADANAQDGASAVESVELTFTSATTGSVRVVTSAWDAAAGESGVRVPLLSMLGFDRVNVGAVATAIFDHPRSGQSLPLIIDDCEYQTYLKEGLSEVTLTFHSPSSQDPWPPEDKCPANPANWDFPGGFGWLKPNVDGECAAYFEQGDEAPADPGNDIPEVCLPVGVLDAIYEKSIMLPLYTGIKDRKYLFGDPVCFHVKAYKLSSGNDYTLPAGFKCPNSPADVCLQGYFAPGDCVVTTGEPGGDDNGVVLVKLVE